MRGYGRKRPIPDPPEWTYVEVIESVIENRGSRWTLRLDVHGLPHLDPKSMYEIARYGINVPPWMG